MIHDLRFALRRLARQPGLTTVAVLTLAVGIGATTAILTLVEHLGLALFPARVAAVALSAFGAVAILLGSVGTYRLVSYGVARRTREICIRLAVGASRRHIVDLAVGRAGMLWLAGASVGAALAIAGGGMLSPVLFGITPTDAGVFALAGVILAIVTAAACILPTRRALRADPAGILRSE